LRRGGDCEDECSVECEGLGCIACGFACSLSEELSFASKSSTLEGRCFTFEEIAISECPALDVIEVCESYFCGGCTSDFCFDFPFPALFSGCEAIDCETIECDGAYDIKVDGSPSWTTIVDGEEVQITCE